MESWRVFRERAEGSPKKQNAPALPRRNFLQEQVYHTITYCQEKFCKITKKLFTPLFSVTFGVGTDSAAVPPTIYPPTLTRLDPGPSYEGQSPLMIAKPRVIQFNDDAYFWGATGIMACS